MNSRAPVFACSCLFVCFVVFILIPGLATWGWSRITPAPPLWAKLIISEVAIWIILVILKKLGIGEK